MQTWCMSFVCCSQTGLLRIAKENRVKLITTWQCRSCRRHSTFYCDSHFGARIFLVPTSLRNAFEWRDGLMHVIVFLEFRFSLWRCTTMVYKLCFTEWKVATWGLYIPISFLQSFLNPESLKPLDCFKAILQSVSIPKSTYSTEGNITWSINNSQSDNMSRFTNVNAWSNVVP